jgi:acetyl-CoA carboxylase biotin carboxyl carrier protein
VDAKEIRELIELISRSNFSAFEMEREGFRLRLVKDATVATGSAPPIVHVDAPGGATSEPVTDTQLPAAVAEPAAGLFELNSPIVGTFYRAASPDGTPFTEIGSRVKKGQPICIVEAMKVMNEIESEVDAEVVDIPVANGQPVEYGEVLFRLRPLN